MERFRISSDRRRCGRAPAAAAPASADPIGKGLTMYMQMGGNAGDGATLARQTGAAQAAAALGVDSRRSSRPGRRRP